MRGPPSLEWSVTNLPSECKMSYLISCYYVNESLIQRYIRYLGYYSRDAYLSKVQVFSVTKH